MALGARYGGLISADGEAHAGQGFSARMKWDFAEFVKLDGCGTGIDSAERPHSAGFSNSLQPEIWVDWGSVRPMEFPGVASMPPTLPPAARIPPELSRLRRRLVKS